MIVERGDTPLSQIYSPENSWWVGGWAPSKIARIGFNNQILRDAKGLSYIRQPTMNFPG